MKNKQVKQMIFDCARKGRNLCWFGEDSEVFFAKSEKQLVDELGCPDPDFPDEQYAKIKNPIKFMWNSKGYCDERGVQPIISWVYGSSEDCSQILSSYA